MLINNLFLIYPIRRGWGRRRHRWWVPWRGRHFWTGRRWDVGRHFKARHFRSYHRGEDYGHGLSWSFKRILLQGYGRRWKGDLEGHARISAEEGSFKQPTELWDAGDAVTDGYSQTSSYNGIWNHQCQQRSSGRLDDFILRSLITRTSSSTPTCAYTDARVAGTFSAATIAVTGCRFR